MIWHCGMRLLGGLVRPPWLSGMSQEMPGIYWDGVCLYCWLPELARFMGLPYTKENQVLLERAAKAAVKELSPEIDIFVYK
jgi:hypothetical protein